MKKVRGGFKISKEVSISLLFTKFCFLKFKQQSLVVVSVILFSIFGVSRISAQTYTTAQNGAYDVGSTWMGGIAPLNISIATININHNVTLPAAAVAANSFTINSGGILTVSSSTGTLTANNAVTISGGTLSNTGGIITVGTAANNKMLTLSSGSLTISGGTTNVNGNINMTGGGFTMSGGNLNVDPNSGVTGTSVAATIDILAISGSTTTSVSGGTITFIDPPYNNGSKRSFSYSATANADWAGNTMIFGGISGTNSSKNDYGFLVDTRYNAMGYVVLGNVVVNGGSYSLKKIVTGSNFAANGFDIGGTLTINANCDIQTLAGGAALKIKGDIINAGKFYDLGTISFSNRLGSNTTHQTVSKIGGGIYSGTLTDTIDQSFSSLEFDNTATPIAVTIDAGELFVGGVIAFTNGAIDVGSANQFIFTITASATRVNGFMLRPGKGQMAKLYPIITSPSPPVKFIYHIADTIGTFDYSPVTIEFTANSLKNRSVATYVVDKKQPEMDSGSVQTDYITRYWRVAVTPGGTFTNSASFQYIASDTVGREAKMQTNLWTGYAWAQAYSNADTINHTLNIAKITELTWPNDTLTTAFITGRFHQPTTYYWIKTGSSTYDWRDPTYWNPQRNLVSSSDSLIFDNKTNIKINNVRTSEVISVLQLKNSSIILQPPSTTSALLELVGGIGNVLDIQGTSSLQLKSNGVYNMGLGFRGAQNANISGTLTLAPSTTASNNTYDGRNCITNIDGTINNAGSVIVSSADSLIIPGTYNHAFTTFGGTIPMFTGTTSTKTKVTGYTTFSGLMPSGLNSRLFNFTYNCPLQTGNIVFQGSPAFSIDTFNLVSTGTGSVNLTNGSSLKFTGPVSYTAGRLFGDSATIIMNGTSAQTIPVKSAGSLIVDNNGGATAVDTLKIIKVLTIANGQLSTANKLILKSTSEDSTARVAQIISANPVPVSGYVTVERYIPPKRAYRFLSPSVTTTGSIRSNWQENGNNAPGYGTHITGKTGAADGFDVTATNNPSLYFYNNPIQRWDSITNTNTNILYAGNAYRLFVRGDRTTNLGVNNPPPTPTVLRTYGTLKYGDITYDKNGLNNTPKMIVADSAINSVGNPYASSIDWEDILKLNTSFQITGAAADIYPTYSTFDSRLGSSTTGVLVSYNAASHTNSIPISQVSQYIQAGQAFFIITSKSATNPYITFKESNKVANVTHVYRTEFTTPKLSVLLNSALNDLLESTVDGFVSVYADNFSDTIGLEDSYKSANARENIAIHRHNHDLSIEGRPLAMANDSLPLKIWNYKQKNYYLKVTSENFDPSLKAFLKDVYLNTETPIRLDSITWLPFNIDNNAASYASDRFSIVFKTGEILPVALTNVSAYQKEKGIQVDWTAQSETNVESYQVEKYDGQHFAAVATVKAKNNGAVTQSYNWFDANVTEGINLYRIKITDKSGAIKYTQAVRVNIGTLKSEFAVYPNPVKGKIISVHFTNLKKGHYSIIVYNNAGQKVLTSSIEHNGGSGTYNLSAGKLATGNYKMIVDNGDTKMNENIIIAD